MKKKQEKAKIKVKKEISNESALKILSGVLPPIIFAPIVTLASINPVWSVLFVSAMGLINVWGSFGQARINELIEFIDQHKTEFLDDILKTDKFKSIFLNVLERHMKETMKEKREILRNYLLNVGQGTQKKFNHHTKILFILDQISFEEIDLLKWLKKNQHSNTLTAKKIKDSFFYSGNPPLNATGTDRIEFILQSLGNYGVIFMKTGRWDGTYYEISNFGKIFLDFVNYQ